MTRAPIAVALDGPDRATILGWAAATSPSVSVMKVGLETYLRDGAEVVAQVRSAAPGCGLFLDLKLHDIPNTVEKAARQVSRLGAVYLTVHAYPQTMKAALAGVAGTDTQILGVTVMTSMTDADLAEAGYAQGVADTVARRADQARAVGVAGLILSPHELAAMRARVGRSLRLITPGVRPAGAALGDQKRVATPGGAIRDGADALVVGRPVTEADDPAQAARAIVAEIAAAQSGR